MPVRACPRLVKGLECYFGDEKCWYSHKPSIVNKAKAADKKTQPQDDDTKKQVCRFFKKYGTCRKGDQCEFSHDEQSEGEPTGVAINLGCPAVACPLTEEGASSSADGAQVTSSLRSLVHEAGPGEGDTHTDASLRSVGSVITLDKVPAEHLINNHMP